MSNSSLPIVEEVRATFRYEPESGLIYRLEPNRFGFDHSLPTGKADRRGYILLNIKQRKIMAHRVAWVLHYGEWPKGDIDHIDRDTSNNRINNLRVVTVTQNSENRSMQGAVPAKSVYWEKNRRKFSAQIKVAGVTRFLGRLENIDEAAHAYNKAAVREQGEFALLNPIGKDKE